MKEDIRPDRIENGTEDEEGARTLGRWRGDEREGEKRCSAE